MMDASVEKAGVSMQVVDSEIKVPIVATVSLDDMGHPRDVKLATLATFSLAANANWD